jgi:nucleotide-binding universal stress UspA family protein
MAFTQHILVPTDFSQASELAVHAAAIVARQNGARVTLLHVLGLPMLYDEDLEQARPEARELEAAVHDHLDRVVEKLLGDLPDVKTALLRDRSPAEAICQWALEQDVDLIVVATHGRTGLTHFLIGSVAERVVRHAPCPVLTMRSRARGRTSGSAL